MKGIKKLVSAILCAPLIFAAACKGGNNKNDASAEKFRFSADFPDVIEPEREDITAEYEYDPSLFYGSSYEFRGKLAVLSFGLAAANDGKENISDFFAAAGFTDAEYAKAYDETPTENSVAYAFAKKKLGENNLIAVSVRGFKYDAEWAGNFNVGKDCRHDGFYAAAGKIYAALGEYLKKHFSDGDKLWITGYSRGGACAGALGTLINDDVDFIVADKKDVFVYTFESPAGAPADRNADDRNIFNVTSSADAVCLFPPEEYGFKRAGTDIDVFSENYKALAENNGFRREVREYKSDGNGEFPEPKTLYKSIIGNLIAEKEDYKTGDISTREKYVENLQTAAEYAFILCFSMNYPDRVKFAQKIAEGLEDGSRLVGMLFGNGLYSFIKETLDGLSVSYDDERLKNSCALIKNVLLHYAAACGGIDGMRKTLGLLAKNVGFIMQMHSPEMLYPLLLNKYGK